MRASFDQKPLASDTVNNDRRARLLRTLLPVLVACTSVAGLAAVALGVPATAVIARLLPAGIGWVLCWLVLRARRVALASLAFVVVSFVAFVALAAFSGGIGSPLAGNLLTLIFLGGALLGRRVALVLAAGAGIASGAIAVWERLGALSTPLPADPRLIWLAGLLTLTVAGVTALRLLREHELAYETIRTANRDLEELKERQSAQIGEQERVLRAAAEISHRLSTILDRSELVSAVVNQVQQAFDYYYVHVYLVDEAEQALIMAGGTGDAGRALLTGQHRLPAGKGLVGRAVRTRAPVLAPDVRAEPAWLPNPLLPDTRAEAAVPILVGDQVIGVLDVQQDVVRGLGQSDVDMLQLIANQVAIALQTAESFATARRKALHESLVNVIGQRIQEATTVEDVLAVAAGELGGALETNHAVVEMQVHGDGQN